MNLQTLTTLVNHGVFQTLSNSPLETLTSPKLAVATPSQYGIDRFTRCFAMALMHVARDRMSNTNPLTKTFVASGVEVGTAALKKESHEAILYVLHSLCNRWGVFLNRDLICLTEINTTILFPDVEGHGIKEIWKKKWLSDMLGRPENLAAFSMTMVRGDNLADNYVVVTLNAATMVSMEPVRVNLIRTSDKPSADQMLGPFNMYRYTAALYECEQQDTYILSKNVSLSEAFKPGYARTYAQMVICKAIMLDPTILGAQEATFCISQVASDAKAIIDKRKKGFKTNAQLQGEYLCLEARLTLNNEWRTPGACAITINEKA